MVWELACHPQSTITTIADSAGLKTRRLTLETGWDLSLEDSRRRALVLARRENPPQDLGEFALHSLERDAECKPSHKVAAHSAYDGPTP